MNGLAQAAALISAVAYIAAAPLELFFFDNPGCGSTDCLIAGPEDDQSDDRADAGEQVAEAGAECPHADVRDVVGLHMEESSSL